MISPPVFRIKIPFKIYLSYILLVMGLAFAKEVTYKNTAEERQRPCKNPGAIQRGFYCAVLKSIPFR